MNEKWRSSRKPDLPAVPTYLYKQDTDKKGLRLPDFNRQVHPSFYADDAAFIVLPREELIEGSTLITTELHFARLALRLHLRTKKE